MSSDVFVLKRVQGPLPSYTTAQREAVNVQKAPSPNLSAYSCLAMLSVRQREDATEAEIPVH